MAAQRWLYATVDFAQGKAQMTILMPNGNHHISVVSAEQEAYTMIAQMGSEGWELTGVHPLVRTESSYVILKREKQAASA